MNPMMTAMRELSGMDDLANMDSFLHRRHPLTKLLVTLVYIAAIISVPGNQLSVLIPLLFIPAILYTIAGIPVGLCFYRLRYILPLLAAVGIWNPLLDRRPVFALGGVAVTAGMISFVTLMLKGILTLLMSFLLMATTTIDAICYAFRLLHVPEILVTQFMITYRYIALMLREAGTMTDAYRLRAPGQRGIHISAWGSFLGSLLLRSMDRADALYGSMRLRGFTGTFRYARTRKADRQDVFYAAAVIAAILFLRCFPLSQMIGHIVTGR